MEYLIAVICSVVVTTIVSVIYHRVRVYGVVQIDNSNPEEPIWRIKLNENVDDLITKKKKKMMLYVDYNADLSQK